VDRTGTLRTDRYDTQVERSGTGRLSDVQSHRVAFSGQSSFDLDSSFPALYRDVRRSYALDYRASYDGIVYDRTTDRFSGRIVYAYGRIGWPGGGIDHRRELRHGGDVDVRRRGDGDAGLGWSVSVSVGYGVGGADGGVIELE